MRVVVLRSVSFVMTPPAISIPVSKEVTSKNSRSCTCKDASPERMTTMMNTASHNRSRVSRVALVGLLQIFREAELFATPEPAPTTLERARVLRGSRRRRPQGPTNRHDPRKYARAQNEPTSEAAPTGSAQSSGRRRIKCPSTWSAWRLCAVDGDACREHAD